MKPTSAALPHGGIHWVFLAGDRVGYASTNAGPSLQSVDWFHDHDVAAPDDHHDRPATTRRA